MATEIERKFLIVDDGWKSAIVQSARLRDGLIASNNGHKARVRIMDGSAIITLKSRKNGPSRTEFEYEIPRSDAEEILRTMCDGNILDKVRHYVSHESVIWHVDVYDGLLSGVILAEVELQDVNQKLELPSWIGREVTTDPAYRKINMFAQRLAALREKMATPQNPAD
jgi:adenylate cyclase